MAFPISNSAFGRFSSLPPKRPLPKPPPSKMQILFFIVSPSLKYTANICRVSRRHSGNIQPKSLCLCCFFHLDSKNLLHCNKWPRHVLAMSCRSPKCPLPPFCLVSVPCFNLRVFYSACHLNIGLRTTNSSNHLLTKKVFALYEATAEQTGSLNPVNIRKHIQRLPKTKLQEITHVLGGFEQSQEVCGLFTHVRLLGTCL